MVFDIENRNPGMNEVDREILLSFWKVHILHHAGEEPIHGQWIIGSVSQSVGDFVLIPSFCKRFLTA